MFVDYPINVVQDVNGVGLLYFASLFSISENALLRLWQKLGRSDRSFHDRTIHDARVCYLANADIDAVLRLRLRTTHNPKNPAEERTEIRVDDVTTNRVIAVAAFRHTA